MMNTPSKHQTETTHFPILSSKNRGWENIIVEQFQHPPGEGNCHCNDEHTIYLCLAPCPFHLLQIPGGKTYTGLYAKGDISVIPAKTRIFARWDGEDHYLRIRIPSRLIQSVARETIDTNPEQLELLPNFRTRDPQIKAIAMMLLSELKQENLGERLYIESLTNILAVHLLRKYSAYKPDLTSHEAGLAEYQLLQVLEYINEHLNQDIKLADLAQLLGISQYHFSRLFKQSIGTAPYQYLLQQRIERAKQLLKETDKSIMEIAFLCGFNSHSHLSKQFRQFIGMTPKAYRAN